MNRREACNDFRYLAAYWRGRNGRRAALWALVAGFGIGLATGVVAMGGGW